MDPMELVDLLNEPESEEPIDRRQVYRWLKGSIPRETTLVRIAAALALESSEDLFKHPDEEWLARFMRGRSDDERERIKATLVTAFPPKAASGRS